MTLHCIYSRAALSDGSLARSLGAGDTILLLDSAVTAADACAGLPDPVRVFALSEDLDAHGVTRLSARVTPIDYAQWVALTAELQTQQVWA